MTRDVKRLINTLGAIVLVIALAMAAWGIYVSRTAGLLRVSSTNKSAVITVSQVGHEAKIIGTGTAKVHLKPGYYQVAASFNGKQDFAVAQVATEQTSSVSLNPVSTPQLPSVATIMFDGEDTFIDQGLSTTQVNALKQDFFKFKPTAKTVAIDPASVRPGPHNPDTDIGFSTAFSVKVDSASYKGLVRYTDLTSVRLFLYDPQTNKLVFDSGNIQ